MDAIGVKKGNVLGQRKRDTGSREWIEWGTTKEPDIRIVIGKQCVDFDPWMAYGATRDNTNGKGVGQELPLTTLLVISFIS